MDSTTNKTEGNEHKRESCLVEFFSRLPPSAGSLLRFRRLIKKIRQADIMYYLDGRGGVESPGVFGELVHSSAIVTGGAFREREVCSRPLLSNIWSRRTTRMYSEFGSFFYAIGVSLNLLVCRYTLTRLALQ